MLIIIGVHTHLSVKHTAHGEFIRGYDIVGTGRRGECIHRRASSWRLGIYTKQLRSIHKENI